MLPFFKYFLCFVFIQSTLAGFSIPIAWLDNNIQKDSYGNWCFYPASGSRAVLCGGDFTPQFNAHLKQTVSIGYYNADGTLLGGAQWPFQTSIGRVTLCVSGKAGDGTYQTMCSAVYADNSPGSGSYCQMSTGQDQVTDGCYVPEKLATPPPSSSSPSDSSTTPPSPTAVPPPASTDHGAFSEAHKSMLEAILSLIAIVIGFFTALLGVKRWRRRRQPQGGADLEAEPVHPGSSEFGGWFLVLIWFCC